MAVKPDSNVTINSVANNATIIFANAGVYTVTATLGGVYAEYIVTVETYSIHPIMDPTSV